MNISLLISGNLTGFGRFYTSPAAKELLGADKIDLDNHNHISFLGDNEKAYSITFAQRFIAISLYTRILDSFRRPGELVVTLLIPRNQIIVPNSGSPIGAVYSLLNKVCDKFFEKNFQDGMINQNPVVLGQDYYSEILDNYRLKPMNMREVNINPSSVKKVGYVKAQENDIPKYLDTPCRENYNDHNLIIIAQSAPAGIDEEPEEVILYSIHIKNNGATLPGRIKLTSPIYKYQAQAGEKPFPIQGSYKDAVEHLLEPRITARILPNDVVEISYNFEKEEKTVNFIFLDKNTSSPISIDIIQPSVVMDGSKLPISSDSFTFRGNEIYVPKKLVSDNSNYTISKRSEILDLSRIGNNQDFKVYVEQGFVLPMSFNKPYDVRKSIVFINRLNGQTESFEVADRKTIHLTGTAADWEFYINSDTYCAPQQPIRYDVRGQWIISSLEKKKVVSNPPQATATVSNNANTVAIQKGDKGNGNSSISLTGEGAPSPSGTPKKFNYKKLAMFVIPFLCVLGGAVFYFWNNSSEEGDNNEDNENTELYAYGAYICYYDKTNDTLTVNQKNDLPLKISYLEVDSDVELDNCNISETSMDVGDKMFFVQKFTNTDIDNAHEVFAIRVEYEYKGQRYNIVDQKVHVDRKENESMMDTIGVDLKILTSQLGYFSKLEEIEKNGGFANDNDKSNFLSKIQDISSNDIRTILNQICQGIEVRSTPPVVTPKEDVIRLDDLSKADFDFGKIQKYKRYGNQKLADGKTVKQRIDALKVAKRCLNSKNGALRPDVTFLSKDQGDAIASAFNQKNPETVQRATKGKTFNSIAAFKNFIDKEL